MTTPSFEHAGFIRTEALIDNDRRAALISAIEQLQSVGAGTRQLLRQPWCNDLASTLTQHPVTAPFMPLDPVAVQCTLFEKSQTQNWLVPLHQDLSLPVHHRIEHPDLTGWSTKEGMLFVQPPASMLGNMLALRLHLDPCGPHDGALRVVPGSHRLGRLAPSQALAQRAATGEVLCDVAAGAAMLLKPLLLHASSKASGASKRRVLHFVFGPRVLPYGLRWPHAE